MPQEYDREALGGLLEIAKEKANSAWEARQAVEAELGCDFDGDIEAYDVDSLILAAEENAKGDDDDEEEEEEEEDRFCVVPTCYQEPQPDSDICIAHTGIYCEHGKHLLEDLCDDCADDLECDCDDRSWRGKLHDSACVMAGRRLE